MGFKDSLPQNEILIRGYSLGDEGKINEMFNEVFAQNRDITHWYWKYRDNPYGSYVISLAVTSDGILAAHYAGYPTKLCFYPSNDTRPTETMVYQLGDKMTRSSFRATGFGKNAILARTFSHFKKTFTTQEAAFAYGFLTHHSLRFGLLLLGYSIIEPVCYRRLALETLSGLDTGLFEQNQNRISITPVSDIDETWTEFFNSAASAYCYLIKRDAVYLRWRYIQRPDRKYLILVARKEGKITGWSVFYRTGAKIIWGDALFQRDDIGSVKAILKYLFRHPDNKGCAFLECWFPTRPEWWDTLINSLGFINGTEPDNLRFCITNITDKNVSERLTSYFYYTMGDSDLF